MSIVEAGDDGALHVPAELMMDAKPHAMYVLDVYDDLIVLRPIDRTEPLWKKMNPAQRAEEFKRWADTPRPPAPDIPLEFLDREHIYD